MSIPFRDKNLPPESQHRLATLIFRRSHHFDNAAIRIEGRE